MDGFALLLTGDFLSAAPAEAQEKKIVPVKYDMARVLASGAILILILPRVADQLILSILAVLPCSHLWLGL